MQKKNKIIAGLDIGGKKICVIVGEVGDNAAVKVLGVWQQDSDGVRDGAIFNTGLAANAIQRAINIAEKDAGCNIDYVHVGIAANRMEGTNSFGVVILDGGEVSSGDLDSVNDIARTVKLPADRQILRVITQYYNVDGSKNVNEPLGVEGVRLELFAHLLTCSSLVLQNTQRAMEKVGLNVVGVNAKHIAAALATTSTFDRDKGVVVIDVGESGTGMAIYKDSFLIESSMIPLGAKDITGDIAMVLKIPAKEALRIKERYGCAFPALVKRDMPIEIEEAGSRRDVSRRRLTAIVTARLEEIFSLAYEEAVARRMSLQDFPGGVVITGATAKLEGVVELAQSVFGVPASVGIPQGLSGGWGEMVNSPQHATAAGLLLECAEHLAEEAKGSDGRKKASRIGGKIRNIMADLF